MPVERLTCDISRDLRAPGPWPSVRLLTEAADKLDGLIALLAEAETARDDARNQIKALHAAIEQWNKSAAAYQATALDAAAERDQARTDAANLRREIDTMWHNIRVGNPYGLTRDQMANNERFSAEMGRRLDAAELDGGTDGD